MGLNFQEQNLLQELLSDDTMNVDVLEALNVMKKEKVLQLHTFKITPPKTKGSRWQTYVWKEEEKKRVKVSAEEEKTLYEKLYQFYFPSQKETLESFYPKWLEKRKSENISPRTIRRNQNHWDKYYNGNTITRLPLEKLSTDTIEQFLHGVIKKFNITVKELKNMQFLITDMLKMARRKGVMKVDPFRDITIQTTGCKAAAKKSSESRIYLPHEKDAIFEQLNRCINENPGYTDPYAVLLSFKLGLRIGEAVALKWSDIDFNKGKIHIHRMETLLENETGELRPAIVPYTKKKSPHGNRFLPLSSYEIDIFLTVKEINEQYGFHEDDFVFCDRIGRTKIREIDYCIRTLCQHAQIPEKSAHDIRRTVASEMFNVGHIPIEIIRDYLGHSDVKTTWDYIVNTHDEEQTREMIINALKGLDGLHMKSQGMA